MFSPEQRYQRNLAEKAVIGRPTEDILYAVFNEFAILHQQRHRFVIYPQMNLKWKPQDTRDRRSEVPDFGLGNFTLPNSSPNFKLRCGVEAKRAINIMTSLPPASSIMHIEDVESLFHILSFQAENQAKAAYKNGYPLSDNGVQWILLVGPYWVPKMFGPFSEAESTVRAHKTSGSADFEATMELLNQMEGPPPQLDELYLLSTQESFSRLEEIIASTDQLAQPFTQTMTSWYVAAHSGQLVMSLTELPELAQCSFSLFDGRKDVLLVNRILYCTLRQLSSRTMIENGTLYLQLCPRRVGSPFLSRAPLESGNPSFSWDCLCKVSNYRLLMQVLPP